MATTLSVIVPVYNEEYLVEGSLRRLAVLGDSPLLDRIRVIVVDDCSTDDTPARLRHYQASLAATAGKGKFEWLFLEHETNRGKGAAIRTALVHADTELTVIHDADLEYQPSDLLRMLPLFTEQNADAVFGSRFLASGFRRVLFFRHALANRFITFLCDLICDLNLTDIETCYKMVRTTLLKSIPLHSSDFRIEPELTIKLAKRGANIFEVPISYAGRTYLEGKKIGWRDGVLALQAFLKYAVSDQIYRDDEYGSAILARLHRAPRFTRWMADTVRPYVGDRVLEIGAGIGTLTVNLLPRPVYWATDINPLYVDALRKLSQTRPYLNIARTDITDRASFPLNQSFETVICLNVVEHVADDSIALKNIYDVLEQGGRAIILVPQGERLFGSLDRVLGHHRRYTKEQLISLGAQVRFRVHTVFGFNRVGTPAWWINGRLLHRATFGLAQIMFLNLLVPLLRRLDPWLPLPALSLIAIYEKVAEPDQQDGIRDV